MIRMRNSLLNWEKGWLNSPLTLPVEEIMVTDLSAKKSYFDEFGSSDEK